jgi:hypothetical protein
MCEGRVKQPSDTNMNSVVLLQKVCKLVFKSNCFVITGSYISTKFLRRSVESIVHRVEGVRTSCPLLRGRGIKNGEDYNRLSQIVTVRDCDWSERCKYKCGDWSPIHFTP